MSRFFVVRDPKTCKKNFNNEPTVEYSSLKAAQKEAGRLVSEQPYLKLYVVKAVKYVYGSLKIEEEKCQ